MPSMRRLILDARGIPTGAETAFGEFDRALGDLNFDDGFALNDDRASFAISGGTRRITVEFIAGFRYAQVFAPPGKDFIAFEPMTAPTSALTSGRGLQFVPPTGRHGTSFRIAVDDLA